MATERTKADARVFAEALAMPPLDRGFILQALS